MPRGDGAVCGQAGRAVNANRAGAQLRWQSFISAKFNTPISYSSLSAHHLSFTFAIFGKAQCRTILERLFTL